MGLFVITYIFEDLVLFECICLFLLLPDSEILCCSCENVFSGSFDIRNPHYFGWWELVLEFVNFGKPIVGLIKIQINNINLVVH